jgi:lysyl-tRNA synthetase class 2
MHHWQPHNFDKRKPHLLARMRIIQGIRQFFERVGYWEVETPALQVMPCADMHIHGFHTEYFGPDLKKRHDFYLNTSPEFEMKKLLVAGAEKIYQICKVYRNGESTKLHSPEFSMLEWYRVGVDYTAIMDETQALIHSLSKVSDVREARGCKLNQPFERLSVTDAFKDYAGIDLDMCLVDTPSFAGQAEKAGIRIVESDGWDDIFHAVMADKIEPYLGKDAPVFLYDYPASMACLSKRKDADPRYAERFELYIAGIEIANAFTELTDAAEQRKRFTEEMAAKQAHYGFSYPLDEDFLSALEHGMPECAGIALGVDRLCMLLSGAEVIDEVLWSGKPA